VRRAGRSDGARERLASPVQERQPAATPPLSPAAIVAAPGEEPRRIRTLDPVQAPSASRAAPLSDAVIAAVAGLFAGEREPAHSVLDFHFERASLRHADPANERPTGKEKRVRRVLTWAIEHDPERGGQLVSFLIAALRGCGGFRPESPNFIGADDIENARQVFRAEGFELGSDGDFRPLVLENLSGPELTAALEANVRRARQGVMDAALLAGTGKDLLEATAAHVLNQCYGFYNEQANFLTLLGQAFTAVGLVTSAHAKAPGEPPEAGLQRALFAAACAVNTLRNKEGTGHGRPFLPTLTVERARIAVPDDGNGEPAPPGGAPPQIHAVGPQRDASFLLPAQIPALLF